MVQHLHTAQRAVHVALTFHVARDPEFLEGVRDGRQLFQEQDVVGSSGWRSLDEVLAFVQHELSSANQEYENQVRACFDATPRTPIYHVGLVAGYLSVCAEVALASASLTARGGHGHA